jgi:quercetin dioxygenase-like cupin family protein
MTFALWRMDEGTVLPRHSHPHEQVVHMLEGALELTVGDERTLLEPGMVLVIPADVPHEGRALTAVRVMDAFAPVRVDYRDGGPTILATAAAK